MSRMIFAAAIAAMCIGMMLVYAGVIGQGMIVPGAVLIGSGMILAAVGGVMQIVARDESVNHARLEAADGGVG